MRGFSGKIWKDKSKEVTPPSELIKEFGPKVAQILANRGIKRGEQLTAPLPTYSQVPNLEEVCERIGRAILEKKRIVIFGDYDVDGILSTLILYETLKELGVKVKVVLPSRKTGYGINREMFLKFSKRYDLLITLDNGTSAYGDIDGKILETIVIDHHNPPQKLPNCLILNPKLSKTFEEFCTTTLSYLLSLCLRERFSLKEDRDHLALVGIATLGDAMDLTPINQRLIKEALKALKEPRRIPLKLLTEGREIDEKNINFYLVPLLNSPGRVSDPRIALKFLLQRDYEGAKKLLKKLMEINERRKRLTEFVERSAKRRIEGDERVLVLWDSRWQVGVLGIVAGKLSEELSKPVGIFNRGEELSVGSLRHTGNIYKSVERLSHLYERWGGHKSAVGITLKSEKLNEFKELLNSVYEEEVEEDFYDFELKPEEALKLYQKLKTNFYFGEGFKPPTFLSNYQRVEEVLLKGNYGFVRTKEATFFSTSKRLLKACATRTPIRLIYSVEFGRLNLRDFVP